jgi:putative FmdB family regulatory protein
MPTYEYACKKCGEHLEVVQSFKDEPLTECPACEGPLRKVFGNIGIAFKGSGFYKTDSRSSATASKAAAAGGGSDKSSSSDGGSSGGSDSGGTSPAKTDGAAAGSTPAKPAPAKPASSAAS